MTLQLSPWQPGVMWQRGGCTFTCSQPGAQGARFLPETFLIFSFLAVVQCWSNMAALSAHVPVQRAEGDSVHLCKSLKNIKERYFIGSLPLINNFEKAHTWIQHCQAIMHRNTLSVWTEPWLSLQPVLSLNIFGVSQTLRTALSRAERKKVIVNWKGWKG